MSSNDSETRKTEAAQMKALMAAWRQAHESASAAEDAAEKAFKQRLSEHQTTPIREEFARAKVMRDEASEWGREVLRILQHSPGA